jgi:hypothetical protein
MPRSRCAALAHHTRQKLAKAIVQFFDVTEHAHGGARWDAAPVASIQPDVPMRNGGWLRTRALKIDGVTWGSPFTRLAM